MMRTDRKRNLLAVAFAVASLSVAPNPAIAAATNCPAPVPDHIPVAPSPPPPLNIGTIKDLMLEYHQKYYDMDVAAVFDVAQKFVEENAAQAKRPALVLDIDETSLTNWPNLIADDFGFVSGGSCDVLPSGPCGFNSWILKSSAKPLEPALKLFNAARARGVAVIFITARPNAQRDATILNLDHAGFEGWTELRTRPDHDGLLTVQEFKTAERTKVEEAEGYTIIANVGDQFSDVNGDHPGLCTFKVPNPFYFIR
jgi:predicted secreted acid phosphatase